MRDSEKSHKELIKEVQSLRRQLAEARETAAEWERTKKALQESEEKYKFLVDNTKEIILILSKSGKIIFANKKALSNFGYSEKEIIGKSIVRFVTRGSIDRALQALAKEFLGQPQPEMEVSVKTKSGRIRYLEVTEGSTPVYKKGKLVGVMISAHDITARREAEEAMRESEMKYKALYDSSRDAIMVLTPEKGVSSGNPAAIRMFRCKGEKEFVSRTLAELSPEYQPDGMSSAVKGRQMMEKAMKEGSHFFEWKYRRMDGTEFFATVLLTRMELKGEKVLQANVRDITERKKAEEVIADTIRELRQFKEVTVGRESRMIELKKEINKLCKELGRPAPYDISFSEDTE